MRPIWPLRPVRNRPAGNWKRCPWRGADNFLLCDGRIVVFSASRMAGDRFVESRLSSEGSVPIY